MFRSVGRAFASKTVVFGDAARKGMLAGNELMLRAAVVSLGPKVRSVEQDRETMWPSK